MSDENKISSQTKPISESNTLMSALEAVEIGKKQSPTIDTSNVTVNAFNAIKDAEKKTKTNYVLGRDDETVWKSPNFKVKVKAWTQDDENVHTYFHSLSIDVNVDDFMGTAELKCPYDSDLMAYWEPIRQTVVIYGANRGNYKILFIGRVRELKQDGYELVITFQNYGWKFKQDVTQSYAKDNVINKDGYTIMRLMFEALKIDSWVISEGAKKRLKQVGINSDGNLTMNGKEVEKIPDLLKRLQSSDPSKLVNKKTLNNKLREKYLHNIKNINYTLKYEKPSPVMKKIASQGSYSGGENIYANPYGSASSVGQGVASGLAGASGSSRNSGVYQRNGCQVNIREACPRAKNASNSVIGYLNTIFFYNHNCENNFQAAYRGLVMFAKNHPQTYSYSVAPCLATIAKYSVNKSGRNAAQITKNQCDWEATKSGASKAITKASVGAVSSALGWVNKTTRSLSSIGSKLSKGDVGGALADTGKMVGSWFGI